jgi:superfamily II DNA or RNA helicase
MSFAVGSLVRARGRDWLVLPESKESEGLMVLRPLGGTEAEVAGVLTDIETVEPATFPPPTLADLGDHRSARMLRDALQLGVRSSAGPFRSFGDIAVTPRPYQLVPLLMALKMDTVRLLIADDVGIGKTVEAGLIAKELLTTGDATGLAVLCPPHLAEQWQRELSDKFHLDAQLVLASTASRLERDLPVGRSIFEAHPITIVSMDFIKSDRHRDDFLRACPNLVIVDEAHTCADPDEGRGARHQRHQLLAGLAEDPDRHVVLATATPHSGKVGAFRSLLSLLDEQFAELADEGISPAQRRQLTRHLVQRRRGDITKYLGDTPFPERERRDETYALSTAYSQLFNDVLDFVRDSVVDGEPGDGVQQRVRWWSALSLLRSLASSPAAAARTLRTRAANAEATDADEVDEIVRGTLFDDDTDDEADGADISPGSDISGDGESSFSSALRSFADRADELTGADDTKVNQVTKVVRQLVAEGFHPIVFCRFIPTAEYVADELRSRLAKSVEVESVTGLIPPAERENRVEALGQADKRVLVATDCLSEGINLQHQFTAVVHYDLPWNPTRLEQREGRVDRFGQASPTVRVATFVGRHIVDRIVEDVLIKKHLQIRKALGVSVPVPATSGDVLEALTDQLLNASEVEQTIDQLRLELPDVVDDFEATWEADAERERESRTVFAQGSIKDEEVTAQLEAAHGALGDEATVQRFVTDAARAHGGIAVAGEMGDSARPTVRFDLSETDDALRDRLALDGPQLSFEAGFAPPVGEHQVMLGRTHPVVAAMAGYVMDTALDPKLASKAARAGVTRTAAVTTRTHLVVVRFRYQLVVRRQNKAVQTMLAEEAQVLAFTGSPDQPHWIDAGAAPPGDLLNASVAGNVTTETARDFLAEALGAIDGWGSALEARAQSGAARLAEGHANVRDQAKMAGSVEVTPALPVDVLGVYVLLPMPGGAA